MQLLEQKFKITDPNELMSIKRLIEETSHYEGRLVREYLIEWRRDDLMWPVTQRHAPEHWSILTIKYAEELL